MNPNWNGKIDIHPTAYIHPSVILEGIVTVGAYTYIGEGTVLTAHVTVGHHCLIQCNVVIRGGWIGNYVHIYDCVSIEQGRPPHPSTTANGVADRLVIGDHCWINHGATMHGTRMGDGSAVGLNACCDYNTRLGAGAVLANGSATCVDQVIPENAYAQGVPARVVQEHLTDADRKRIFGLVPTEWTRMGGEDLEAAYARRMGGSKG